MRTASLLRARLAAPAALGALLLAACSGAADPPPATDDAAAAEAVARAFFDSVDAGDKEGWRDLLTARAQAELAALEDDAFQFRGEELDSFVVGGATVTGEDASVPMTIVSGEEVQTVSLEMRLEGARWRVRGVGVPMGEAHWTIDFEGREDFLPEAGEELAEGVATALEDAFAEAMQEWSAGGSPEDIARERAAYGELEPINEKLHDAAWRVDVSGNGRRAREILADLVAGTELVVDEGVHAAAFDARPSLELTGVSRVEAIEELCAELGLVPAYPDPRPFGGSDALPALRFREGPRTRPVAFSGPFLLEVEELAEHPPHATGALTLTARALGLAPAVQAGNREPAEVLRLGGVRTAAGASLLPDDDVRFYGAPTADFGVFVDRTTIELVGLVRDVETLTVEGGIALALPTVVEELDLAGGAGGRGERWTAATSELGTSSRVELSATAGGDPSADVRVRFAPDDAGGAPLGILSSSASAAGDRVVAHLSTPEAPSALALKVYEIAERVYPFRLADVPLARSAEQPPELAPLAFEGESPLAGAFVRFADRSDADFPRVEVTLTNRSNKDARAARVTLRYLDPQGALLHEFPHSLSGPFGVDGRQEPLARAGATTGQETVAFFMPEETDALGVRVDEVTFLDGTTWERGE